MNVNVFFFLSTVAAGLPVIDGGGTGAIHLTVSPFVQWLIMLTGFVVKPTYMILSLLLILLLWKQKTRPMVLIRWALVTFLAGEIFCAANYTIAAGCNETLDILHGTGMVGLGVFLPWGIFAWVDENLLHFSHDKANCSFLKLCTNCWKRETTTCGLKRLFQFTAPTLAIIALLPLTAPLKTPHYTLCVFNVETNFIFPPTLMLWELRIFPILASVSLLVSLLFLSGDRTGAKGAQVPFFIGLGFMFYSLLRFFLLYSFDGLPYWINFWEEFTELMTVSALGVFLLIFRKGLGLTRHSPSKAG
ncbi:MAG: hypothetical protein GY757_13355 [bacterium]|nr:hypothetical protein [bacterium]